jgi:hypothetical protein
MHKAADFWSSIRLLTSDYCSNLRRIEQWARREAGHTTENRNRNARRKFRDSLAGKMSLLKKEHDRCCVLGFPCFDLFLKTALFAKQWQGAMVGQGGGKCLEVVGVVCVGCGEE